MQKYKADPQNRVSREAYARAQSFLNMIRTSKTLTNQQKATLRGQAIHGDLEGAMKGYQRLVNVRDEP